MRSIVLSAGWQLKQRKQACPLADDFASTDGWIEALVPGSTHEALLAAGQIADPFYGLNELDVQWIGECDWLYRCAFEAPPDFVEAGVPVLCCDGLDTFATVWLNGEQVLVSDNMFVPVRVPITSLLRPERNVLHILFESTLQRGKALESEWGRRAVWNGDPSRVYVRKAQFHYGWDWGPTLLTAGPWRAVRLEAGACIAELHCPVEVAEDLRTAALPVAVVIEKRGDISAGGDTGLNVRLELVDPTGKLVDEVTLPAADDVRHSFTLDTPGLWWPNGYGSQPCYRLVARLIQGGAEIDRREQRVGVRRLRLVQEPLVGQPGSSFFFEINNTPIFCGGANWIPADSFTTRLTAEDYRTQLEQAAAANMVMLRVWGGGIYEDQAFYDLCDELGLLVWQDFMFACGIYPAYDAFQQSVCAEAEAQVRRLRHHPSVVLWCGNNEDYQIALSRKVYDASFDGDFAATGFPAREIYERLLPEVCARLDPTRPYRPGSPFGGADPDDPTVGDRHTWEVWKHADYHRYPELAGRFVSEFGMQSLPDLRTIESFTPPEERYPQSRIVEHHNKAESGVQRLAGYLVSNVRMPADLKSYIYATQLVQAEALGLAYRSWRRGWGGPRQYAVAGALVWQLNDCWPVASWAIVDYGRRPKPAYYAIKRALAPLAVGLARGDAGAEVWAANATAAAVEAELVVKGYDLDGTELFMHKWSGLLAPNRVTELGRHEFEPGAAVVIAARLLVDGAVEARATLWPEPFKYLTLPDPALTIARLGDDRLELRVSRPAKGVWLGAGDNVVWSDNMIDVLPGDPQIITARDLGDQQVHVQWLRPA